MPVRVVNAGLPGQGLARSQARLERDVFPRRADLIVTYHGPDGFEGLAQAVEQARFEPPAPRPPRASRIAAAIEDAPRDMTTFFHQFPWPVRKLESPSNGLSFGLSRMPGRPSASSARSRRDFLARKGTPSGNS